ncbi:hypothetical protein PR048_017208 [Dryococelus australis]|uniref:Uncharacterized protein n=1 Tax=Dryococelus australis TaxID=614101 RepID=A0ABQ9H8W5_9NEOP|nr:hypothetical protein PR048_017208 [Dryococelus australis]
MYGLANCNHSAQIGSNTAPSEGACIVQARHWRQARTPEFETAFLRMVDENPNVNTRQLTTIFNVYHTVAWTVLQENILYAYHLQRAHAPTPAVFLPDVRSALGLLDNV